MLTFDEAGHRYFWNGQPVPGVTTIIREACGNPFAGIPEHVLERKRLLGLAAHRACELDALGKLDDGSVHPEVMPYLKAWRAFVQESGFEVEATEQKTYCEPCGYAGRIDFVGDLLGVLTVIDFKTGLPGPLAAIQTAAYGNAIGAKRRFALQGLPNGRYKFPEYTAPGDFADFLAALRVFRLRERINGNH